MKITIEDGQMWLNNMYFSRAAAGNGKSRLTPGTYHVLVRKHKGVRTVYAEGMGYIGGSNQHDVFISGVRSKNRLLADPGMALRLTHSVERHLEDGEVTLEVV